MIRSGLVPMVQTVKKTGVETTFRRSGESSVKVKRSLESTCHTEERLYHDTSNVTTIRLLVDVFGMRTSR